MKLFKTKKAAKRGGGKGRIVKVVRYKKVRSKKK
jgi:hypothetical protein